MLYHWAFAPSQMLSGLPKLFLDVATEKEYSVIFTTPSGIQFGLQSLLLLILAGLLLIGFVGLAAWMTVRQLKATKAAQQAKAAQTVQQSNTADQNAKPEAGEVQS